MPVDKFGRNGDRATPIYTGINVANLTNSLLRRDGGNPAIGAICLFDRIVSIHYMSQIRNKENNSVSIPYYLFLDPIVSIPYYPK